MQPSSLDPTDAIALVLLLLHSLRRSEVRSTELAAHPGVPADAFEAWRLRAVAGRSLAVHACFAKVALNQLWFWGAGGWFSPGLVRAGGLLLFVAWVVGLLRAWQLNASAAGLARRVGILPGRRVEGAPVPAASDVTDRAAGEGP